VKQTDEKEFFERGKQIAKWADNNMAKDKALKMAIEVLELYDEKLNSMLVIEAIQACKEALELSEKTIELKPSNIAKARDEIYYAWRKYWAWGIPSKDGEAVFNANGDGFQAGWLACEEWINKEKNHGL
jgi:hypothetical protein